MGWKTTSGTLAANAGASGLVEWSAGDGLAASDLNANHADGQTPAIYGLPSGILAGGACSADALAVTIPSGTYYLARNVWYADGNAVVNVSDEATTYIWGCADGELRTTSSATPPTGYDERTACILCRAVATGGAASVDLSVQQHARRTIGHAVYEGSGAWSATPDVIASGAVAVVPDAHQIRLMDTLTALGTLVVYGKAVVL